MDVTPFEITTLVTVFAQRACQGAVWAGSDTKSVMLPLPEMVSVVPDNDQRKECLGVEERFPVFFASSAAAEAFFAK